MQSIKSHSGWMSTKWSLFWATSAIQGHYKFWPSARQSWTCAEEYSSHSDIFFLTLARSCPSKHEWEMNTEFAILEIRCISFECYIWNNMMTLCVYVCVCVDGFRRLRSKEQYPPLHAAVPADDIMWPVGPNQGLENHTQDCRQFSCSFVMHVLLVAIIVDSGSC